MFSTSTLEERGGWAHVRETVRTGSRTCISTFDDPYFAEELAHYKQSLVLRFGLTFLLKRRRVTPRPAVPEGLVERLISEQRINHSSESQALGVVRYRDQRKRRWWGPSKNGLRKNRWPSLLAGQFLLEWAAYVRTSPVKYSFPTTIGLSDIITMASLTLLGLTVGLLIPLFTVHRKRSRSMSLTPEPTQSTTQIDIGSQRKSKRRKWKAIVLVLIILVGSYSGFIISQYLGGGSHQGQWKKPGGVTPPAFTPLSISSSGIIVNANGTAVFLTGVSDYEPFIAGNANTYPQFLLDDGVYDNSTVTIQAQKMRSLGFNWAAELEITPDMFLIDNVGDGLPHVVDSVAVARLLFVLQSLKNNHVYVQLVLSPSGPSRGRNTFCTLAGYFSCGGTGVNFFPSNVRIWIKQTYQQILPAVKNANLWNVIVTDINDEEAQGMDKWPVSNQTSWYGDIQGSIRAVSSIWVTVSFVGYSPDENFGILNNLGPLMDVIETHDYEHVVRSTSNPPYFAADLPQDLRAKMKSLNLVKPVLDSETGRQGLGNCSGICTSWADIAFVRDWYRIKNFESYRAGFSGISYWGIWRAWDLNTVDWSFFDMNYAPQPLVNATSPFTKLYNFVSYVDRYESSLNTTTVSGGWKGFQYLLLYNRQGDGALPPTTKTTVTIPLPTQVQGFEVWEYTVDPNNDVLGYQRIVVVAGPSITLTLGAWETDVLEFKTSQPPTGSPQIFSWMIADLPEGIQKLLMKEVSASTPSDLEHSVAAWEVRILKIE